MTLKELAQMYGMSVAELCKSSGYTRQGLNRILRSDKVTYPGRFRAALLHLLVVSKNIAEEETAKAKDRDRMRFETLDKLATAKGVQWKPNQEPFDDSLEGIARRADGEEIQNTCGTCYWFNGGPGDGWQFCDHRECDVADTYRACSYWQQHTDLTEEAEG